MIGFFITTVTNCVDKKYADPEGVMTDGIEVEKIKDDFGVGYYCVKHDGKVITFTGRDPLLLFFVVNLETGETFCNEVGEPSNKNIPNWVFNPLLRAIRLAEYKKSKEAK